MNQQDATRIKELGLDALKNPNPNLRKMALLELRNYDTPLISEVLERVIQKDRDKEVRDLVQNLLTKFKIQAAQRPPKSTTNLQSQSSDSTWKCNFCGAETSAVDHCPSCGAERKDIQSPVAPKLKVDSDTFLLHPSHRDFVLGKSKALSRNNVLGVGCITLFASMFVLFGALFLVFTLRDTYQWFIINQRGIAANAQYVDRRVSSGDDSDTYYVSFRYTHQGSEYSREQRVTWDVYNRAESGGNLEIVYVPFDPQLAKITGTNNAPVAMLLFVVVWNAIVYVIIFFAVRQSRRMKFLERNGKMLPGEVIESTHSTDSDGDLFLKVEYAFAAPQSEKRLTKTEKAQRNDLKKQRPPAPGTPVVILYYNEQHYMLL